MTIYKKHLFFSLSLLVLFTSFFSLQAMQTTSTSEDDENTLVNEFKKLKISDSNSDSSDSNVVVNEHNCPTIHNIVKNLSKKMGMKTPKTIIQTTPSFFSKLLGLKYRANACAYVPFFFGSKKLYIGDKLITGIENQKGLTISELRGTIAHELAHIKLKHHRTIRLLMPFLIFSIGWVITVWILPLLGTTPENLPIVLTLLQLIYCPVLLSWIMRIKEREADHLAGETLEDPMDFAKALQKLEKLGRLQLAQDGIEEVKEENLSTLAILLKPLFMSHPSDDERTKAMLKLKKKKNQRLFINPLNPFSSLIYYFFTA